MKKVILVISTLFSLLQAEITQKQLDDYMKISIGGSILKNIVNNLSYRVLNWYGVDSKEITAETLKKIRDELYKHRYTDQYTRGLKKLSLSDYEEIMDFYRTEIGKKYKKSYDKNNNHKGIKSKDAFIREFEIFLAPPSFSKGKAALIQEFEVFLASHPFSKRKTLLINQIIQELGMARLSIESSFDIEVLKRNTFPKKLKYGSEYVEPIDRISKDIEGMRETIIKHTIIINLFKFRDFTEEELEEILRYATTSAAKTEYLAVVSNIVLYYGTVTEEIIEDRVKEIETKMKKQKMAK